MIALGIDTTVSWRGTAAHHIDEIHRQGGMAIAVGTPEEVAAEPSSHTGQFLAELLGPGGKPAQAPARRRRVKVAA